MWTDASRLDLYQTCPRRYYHKYILRLTPKDKSASPSASFGLGLHAGLETIYNGDGAEFITCEHFGPPVEGDLCLYCQSNGGKIRKMFQEFLRLFPVELEYKVYSQHLGLLLLVRYLEKWRSDPLRDGAYGVETTFSWPLGGIPYVGRVDLLAYWDRVNYVTDHKSKSRITDNFVRGFKLDAKMTGYIWAISKIMDVPAPSGMINTVLVANNITPNSFARFITSRTPADIAQWQDNTMRVLDDISRDTDRNYFPMNSNACFSYNRECEYYRICTATNNPEGAIEQFFDVRPESDLPTGISRELDDE
jgi:hypothetical protein